MQTGSLLNSWSNDLFYVCSRWNITDGKKFTANKNKQQKKKTLSVIKMHFPAQLPPTGICTCRQIMKRNSLFCFTDENMCGCKLTTLFPKLKWLWSETVLKGKVKDWRCIFSINPITASVTTKASPGNELMFTGRGVRRTPLNLCRLSIHTSLPTY